MKEKFSTPRAAICAVLILTAFLSALSAQSQTSRKASFHLSATVESSPELNRCEGDLKLSHLRPDNPLDLSDIASLEPGNLAGSDSKSTAFPSAGDRKADAPPAKGTALPARAINCPNINHEPVPRAANPAGPQPLPAPESKVPKSFLEEVGVDWSSWVSAMSGRWFYNLRMLESQANIQFLTDRPALIQFTCYPSGQMANISLKQSSGVDAYDRLQMLALSQVAPLPFPAGTQCTSITLVQGWESHAKRPGEIGFDPTSFGRGFPLEKVRQWVRAK